MGCGGGSRCAGVVMAWAACFNGLVVAKTGGPNVPWDHFSTTAPDVFSTSSDGVTSTNTTGDTHVLIRAAGVYTIEAYAVWPPNTFPAAGWITAQAIPGGSTQPYFVVKTDQANTTWEPTTGLLGPQADWDNGILWVPPSVAGFTQTPYGDVTGKVAQRTAGNVTLSTYTLTIWGVPAGMTRTVVYP